MNFIPQWLIEAAIAALTGILLFALGLLAGVRHEKGVAAETQLKMEQAYEARYHAQAETLNTINANYLELQQTLEENTSALISQAGEMSKLPQYQIKCFDAKGLGLANQALKGHK